MMAATHQQRWGPREAETETFLDALRARDERALAVLFDRHHRDVERVVLRVLGPDPDVPDVAQDAFIAALDGLRTFRGDEGSLRSWLMRIAVNTARNRLRYRRVRRWLQLSAAQAPEPVARTASPEVVGAARRTYEVLDTIPTDERVPFVLRVIDGMELTAVAELCGMSLSTVKRRIARARRRFEKRAKRDPVLRGWLEEGES